MASIGLAFFVALVIAGMVIVLAWRYLSVRAMAASIGICFGFFYFFFFGNLVRGGQYMFFGVKTIIVGIVDDEPVFQDNVIRVSLRLNPPYRGEVLMISNQLVDIRYGDRVATEGKIKEQMWPNHHKLFISYLEVISHRNGSQLKEWLLDIKEKAINAFHAMLLPNESALVAGLTFGYRGGFNPSLKKSMVNSGTTHIVALSGYNIMLIVFAVNSFVGRWIGRRKKFVLLSCLIPLFVLMVGTEASITRAALMAWLYLLSQEAGRVYQFIHIVVVVSAFLVFINPSVLVYNISFALSFLSLLGLVYLTPNIKNVMPKKWQEGNISEAVAATLGAQLAVLPILLAVFGSVSLVAVFSNILILSATPLATAFGFFVGFGSFLGLWFVAPFIIFLKILLDYQLAVIVFFGSFPVLQAPLSNVWFIIFYYVCFIALIVVEEYPNLGMVLHRT
jgi:competence protein ComEC